MSDRRAVLFAIAELLVSVFYRYPHPPGQLWSPVPQLVGGKKIIGDTYPNAPCPEVYAYW